MMKDLFFPAEAKMIVDFLLSIVFALLIGIELNNRLKEDERSKVFGTDRTFTFIAVLGYFLYIISPNDRLPYLVGFEIVGVILGIYYFSRIKAQGKYGITAIILALLIYVLPVFIITQPRWFSLLSIVIIMTLSEIKPQLKTFSSKIYGNEFLTLSKFLIITGVILPLVPDREFVPYIPVSPHKLWLAVVVISSISYCSYIVRKFIFPNAGLVLSGILGGLYSSTATVFILAKKSRNSETNRYEFAAAILAANTMMFLRVWLIVLFFSQEIALRVILPFSILVVLGLVISYFYYSKSNRSALTPPTSDVMDRNPLELRVAVLFAGLYVFFSLVTTYTIQNFGNSGLLLLSYLTGLTDINPFIIHLFQTKDIVIPAGLIAVSVLNAIAGNTMLNSIYSAAFSSKEVRKPLLAGYTILGTAAIMISLIGVMNGGY